MELEHPEPEDGGRFQRTVVGEIQCPDGGDSGEQLLDDSSSRRPQLARKQETQRGEKRREKTGGGKKNNSISTGTNPNHLKLSAQGIVLVSHTAADCFQCPHVELVSVAYFEGKAAFLLQSDKPKKKTVVKSPQTVFGGGK